MSQELEHDREFKCSVCGRLFTPKYRISRHRTLSSCSKSCAGKLKGGGFHRKADLEKKIISLVEKTGRYLSKDEVLEMLGVSSKTLTAYNVSTLMCNKLAGFKKPARMFENNVRKALSARFVVEDEVCFDGCVSPKGYPLRFDFYIRALGLLVEADGSQHKHGHPWHSEYHSECDRIKDKFAATNGFGLVRIPYSKRVNSEYVFKFLETAVATT